MEFLITLLMSQDKKSSIGSYRKNYQILSDSVESGLDPMISLPQDSEKFQQDPTG